MLKTRQEIKAIAKDSMKAQWGTSIGALILYFVIAGVIGALSGVISVFVPALSILTTLAIYFIVIPLGVNLEGMFAQIYRREQTNVGEMFSKFSVNYLRKVGGMFLVGLFAMLWSLLLIVPGIIKGIAYSMTPFILAECPNVTATDAIKLSMRMTKGHKGKLFVMMLSFIGWYLLSGLTLGILAIVFVNPYYYTTYAGFYVELKENAIANGTIDASEFA